MKGAVPAAVTLNVAVWPAVTVLLAGCAVIEGAIAAFVTLSIAGLLVKLELLSVTTTEYCVPLSDVVTAGVKYDAWYAPTMSVPFFFH